MHHSTGFTHVKPAGMDGCATSRVRIDGSRAERENCEAIHNDECAEWGYGRAMMYGQRRVCVQNQVAISAFGWLACGSSEKCLSRMDRTMFGEARSAMMHPTLHRLGMHIWFRLCPHIGVSTVHKSFKGKQQSNNLVMVGEYNWRAREILMQWPQKDLRIINRRNRI